MNLLVIVLGSAAIVGVAYWLYGGLLVRLLKLDPNAKTPAVELRDDTDYVPIEPQFLLGQHFSAIAAAGPIVGPIVAATLFGWLPALVWILLGAIFIGGVHDVTALIASVRHKARSITEVVKEYMSRRAFLLFLAFIWIALVYIIVAFTDITAQSFLGGQVLEDGSTVSGGGVATSSLLYLALPIVMGLLMRYAGLPLGLATLIFLPLIGVAIWVGQKIPFDLEALLGVSRATALRIWDIALLAYCYVAGLVPMWLLLQPRGHLGGYFLYIALFGGAAGLLIGNPTIQYPAFTDWQVGNHAIFPILFITIACGACSGFHSIVASGTSSKQLKCETDARPVGYGAMLLEAMVAIISVACVMILAKESAVAKQGPNVIYASGIGEFFGVFGINKAFAISFGLLAFATFVYDTLDVCTRLGRYIIEELTGWKTRSGRLFSTALTAGVPLFFLLGQPLDAKGLPVPVWKAFWSLFGASNQLLAALTLLGVTVWLVRKCRARWAWFVTGLPMVFMYVMSVWALVLIAKEKLYTAEGFKLTADPVPWVALVLIGLAGLMLMEGILALSKGPSTPPSVGAVPAPAERTGLRAPMA